jgi:hypothetical protein
MTKGENQLRIIATVTIGAGITLPIVTAGPAHADWNCQPAYGGVETVCTDDSGKQITSFNWGQQAGKCVDMSNGNEVPHPPGA